MRCVLAFVLTGCWVAPVAAPPLPIVPVQRIAPAPQVPDPPPYSVWTGKYLCAQGVSAVEVRIEAAPDGSATATFEFGPHDENPNPVARGSYELTGALFVDDKGVLQAKLTPDHWIDQPPSYVMIGFYASSDPGQRTMKGKIEHSSCDWIEITRTR